MIAAYGVREPLLRRWAVGLIALLIATIPLENVVVLATGSVTKLIGVAAFALGVAALVQGPRLRVRPLPFFLVTAGLFVLWVILSYYWSWTPQYTLSRSVTYVQLLALAWVIWEYGGNETHRKVFMAAYLVGGYAAFALGFAAFAQAGENTRDLGAGFNANDFAVALALGIPIAWRLASLARGRWLYWFALLYLPLALAGVVVAASRGGFITALIALMVVPFTFSGLSVLRKLGLMVLLAAGLWTIFVYGPQMFPNLEANTTRIFQTTQELREGTLTGRREIWAAGWQVFAEEPYLGVGAGGYRFAIAPIYGRAITSHNAFMSVIVELGVGGLVLFLAMFASILVPLLLSARGPKFWYGVLLLLSLVVGIYSLSWEAAKATWFVLALLATEVPWVAVLQAPAGERRLGRQL